MRVDFQAEHSGAWPIDVLMQPLRVFARHNLAGAVLLLFATVVALVWANSPWSAAYHHALHLELGVELGPYTFAKTVHHLINDGLMGIFFFLVGLEIKREVLVGELSQPRQALLPAVAALGGMVVPALVYVAVNPALPERVGWGVPMATDIAFALGVLAVLGSRVPATLKVFLTALAIVDDIGAVLVIAIFYTSHVAAWSLIAGFLGVTVSILMNVLGVRSALAYFLVGTVVWLAFLESGVHATIAALLMAFTIPASTRIDGGKLLVRLRAAAQKLEDIGHLSDRGLNTRAQQHVLDEISIMHADATAPLQNLEHALVPLVTFVVLPIFALANAGIALEGVRFSSLFEGISLGIMLGLVLGKPVGIVAFSWVAIACKAADLPRYATWRHMLGLGLLGGIGFTMALFVGGLAFSEADALNAAKLGTLGASTVAALLGVALLWTSGAPSKPASV